MPTNYDGQYEVRLNYTTVVATVPMDHTMTFDIKLDYEPEPGTPFSEILVSDWNETSSPLDALIDALLAELLPLYNLTTDFTSAELWKIPEGTYDATFLSVYGIGTPGESSTNTSAAHQLTFTWRSTAGGIMKLVLIESISTEQGKYAYPTGSSTWNDVFAFVGSATRPFMARDNTRPFAPLRVSGGQNEAVWRRRYRP